MLCHVRTKKKKTRSRFSEKAKQKNSEKMQGVNMLLGDKKKEKLQDDLSAEM